MSEIGGAEGGAMPNEEVERYRGMFRRYLPLLKMLEAKKYGWVIVQIHGKEPKRFGFLPSLQAVDDGEGGSDAGTAG